MHIPDGFLDLRTAVATGALAAGGLGYALKRTSRTLPPRKVPLLGLAAAFVFAAQMLNFPVAGGTSGHLIGATLTAVLLGPSPAVVVISSVLIVQCFLFADGGITALGANILNMALVSAICGWLIYSQISRVFAGLFGRILAATFAAWCSTVAASVLCAGELASSHIMAWRTAFPAMAGVHAFIGIGEAIITAMVLSTVSASRPDLINASKSASSKSYTSILVYGGIVAFALALFVSPFASPSPDGLDKTAEVQGFAERAKTIISAPWADYQTIGISSTAVSTALAGAAGTAIVFLLAWLFTKSIVRGDANEPDTQPSAE